MKNKGRNVLAMQAEGVLGFWRNKVFAGVNQNTQDVVCTVW